MQVEQRGAPCLGDELREDDGETAGGVGMEVGQAISLGELREREPGLAGEISFKFRQFPGGGKGHRQHRHTVPGDLIHRVRQRHCHFRQRRAIDRLQLAVHQQPAAHFDLPASLQRIYIGKEHFVLYGKGTAVRIHSQGLHRGIYFLHLVILRMHRAVRTDHPVGAKIGIGPGNGRGVWQRIPVPRLFLFKIRAVKPQVRAFLRIALKCLVHKVPDKAAAHIVILFKIRHIVGGSVLCRKPCAGFGKSARRFGKQDKSV